MLPVTKNSGRKSGFKLVTQIDPYTLSQLKKDEPKLKYSCGNVLSARKARWNGLFPKALLDKAPLVEFYPVLDEYGRTDHAYRVVPGRTTLVLVGVETEGEAGVPSGFWNAFDTPPAESAVVRNSSTAPQC